MDIIFNENTRLSQNFTLKELVKSNTAKQFGIINKPNPEQLITLTMMVNEVLQPIRDQFGPLKINSGYRNKSLNAKIKGASASDHIISAPYITCAADIDDTFIQEYGLTNAHIVSFLLNNTYIPIHKLIWEFTTTTNGIASPKWIHLSYSRDSTLKNSRYFYEAIRTKSGISYIPFDRNKFNI